MVVFNLHTFLPRVVRKQMFLSCGHDRICKELPQHDLKDLCKYKIVCIRINLTLSLPKAIVVGFCKQHRSR